MCGLFGVVRANSREVSYKAALVSGNNTALRIQSRAATAFYWLGRLAVSRGADASGLAAFTGRTTRHPATPSRACSSMTAAAADVTAGQAAAGENSWNWNRNRRQKFQVDGWRIYKDTQSFSTFWETHLQPQPTAQPVSLPVAVPIPVIEGAKVLLGHTRQASPTVRGLEDLANASPLVVGDLIGTHNGGVNIRPLLEQFGLTTTSNLEGRTSSEAIFRCLNCLDRNQNWMSLDPIIEVLETMRGRAALVWVDRNQPLRVYLARAAVSPLATARDQDGSFYWASVPEWFELLDQYSGDFFGFAEVEPLEEGTLLVVEARPDTAPVVVAERTFCPTARLKDYNFER
jgi:Glutamine amidotransferase domain